MLGGEGWRAAGVMMSMSSPLADLQDSVAALNFSLRHLCRTLDGNLGSWPAGAQRVNGLTMLNSLTCVLLISTQLVCVDIYDVN